MTTYGMSLCGLTSTHQNSTQELHKNVTSRCHHGNEGDVNNENCFQHLHHSVGLMGKFFGLQKLATDWNKFVDELMKFSLKVFFVSLKNCYLYVGSGILLIYTNYFYYN